MIKTNATFDQYQKPYTAILFVLRSRRIIFLGSVGNSILKNDFYFVHSFAVKTKDTLVISKTHYGNDFAQ